MGGLKKVMMMWGRLGYLRGQMPPGVRTFAGSAESTGLNLGKGIKTGALKMSLTELALQPMHHLKGVRSRAVADEISKKFKIFSVAELADWKFAGIASGIVTLAKCEQLGESSAGRRFNIQKAVDKSAFM